MKREVVDWNLRTGRRTVSHMATVRTGDRRTVRALVTNLSFEGCQLFVAGALYVGEKVTVEIPGRGAIDGQVRWYADDRAGVRFLLGDSVGEARRLRIGV